MRNNFTLYVYKTLHWLPKDVLKPLSMNLMPSFPAVLSAVLPQADLALALGEGELPN